MAEPFANIGDLIDAWGPLSSEQEDRALPLLARVSRKIRALDRSIDDRIAAWDDDPRPANALDPETARDVTCDIVHRTLAALASQPASVGHPVDTVQWGVDIFQESYKFSNPTGDIYLTKAERQELGIFRQRAFSVSLIPDDAGRDPQ